jgi:hypothetical protein
MTEIKDAVQTIDAFAEYLPLSAVRTAPGEYDIKDRKGRTLWRMDGASLADWVAASCNGYETLLRENNEARNSYSATQTQLAAMKEVLRRLSACDVAGWGACWCERPLYSANIIDHESECIAAAAALKEEE